MPNGIVNADSRGRIWERTGVVRAELDVSDPASSSILKFWNESGELLRVHLNKIAGIAYRDGIPAPTDTDLSPGTQAVYDDDASRGGCPSNYWRDDFTIGPLAAGSSVGHVTFRVDLTNAPGWDPHGGPGDNWTFYEYTEGGR